MIRARKRKVKFAAFVTPRTGKRIIPRAIAASGPPGR
jgi:hypothetical protein